MGQETCRGLALDNVLDALFLLQLLPGHHVGVVGILLSPTGAGTEVLLPPRTGAVSVVSVDLEGVIRVADAEAPGLPGFVGGSSEIVSGN